MPHHRYITVLLLLLSHFISGAQVLTYLGDIKPIVDRHCVSCHHPEDVGAMPLTNYDEVSSYGKMIEYVTSTGLMPPWYADATYNHFSNERVLTHEEIQKISDWVSGGMPEGAVLAQHTPHITPERDFQRKPDHEISMAEAFEQYGIYYDQYQVFVLPTHLDTDVWVEGIEFVAGNKKIVRRASISVATSDKFDSLDRWDPRYGYYSFGGLGKTPEEPFWYAWSPQQKATFFPEGTAKFLPKGSYFIVHIHYGPTGHPQMDSSSVRLFFANKKPGYRIVSAPLINPYALTGDSLFIPASTKKIFHASYTIPYDIEVMSLTPQANLICRSWEVFAKIPGQHDPVKLLKIPDWNFNWKQTFYLDSPLFLPEGTVIHALALYDNTLDNPCNPSDKPVAISWGAHLFSELFFVHFEHRAAVIPDRKIQLILPPVVSGSTLNGFLEMTKTDFVEIRIEVLPQGESVILCKGIIQKGISSPSWDISSLPDGNYSVQLSDKNGVVLGQHMLFKLPEKGL